MKHLFLSLVLFFGSFLFAQDVHELARTGTADQMEAFLSKDSSSVNRLSDRGMTPFILACYWGNNEVAKVLLEKGADVGYCAAVEVRFTTPVVYVCPMANPIAKQISKVLIVFIGVKNSG